MWGMENDDMRAMRIQVDENEQIVESKSPAQVIEDIGHGQCGTETLLDPENRLEKSPEKHHTAKRLTINLYKCRVLHNSDQ